MERMRVFGGTCCPSAISPLRSKRDCSSSLILLMFCFDSASTLSRSISLPQILIMSIFKRMPYLSEQQLSPGVLS